MRIQSTILLLLLALAAILPTQGLSDEYRLAPQDKLRVKVLEWLAGKGEYNEWAALAGEYTVNASGAVSLPLLGEIPAEGKTTAEFADAVSDALKSRVGLVNRPDTSVEVIEYRPIYVVGKVVEPGEYAYRPGLTVLQAVGIAGGLDRTREDGLLRLERDRIVAQGAFESARLEMRRMIARRARLQAELAGADTIRVPEEFRDDADGARLIDDEATIMDARREALHSQLDGIEELKGLLLNEVASLDQKIAAQERQIGIARGELEDVSSLVARGLAVDSREFTLERTVAELESRMLDLETASLRAKQEISEAERDALDLRTDREAEIAAELQETEARLDQLLLEIETAYSLINEAAVIAPRLALEHSARALQVPVYSIVRGAEGEAEERPADEITVVEPGDVVRVQLAPAMADGMEPAETSRLSRDTPKPAFSATESASLTN